MLLFSFHFPQIQRFHIFIYNIKYFISTAHRIASLMTSSSSITLLFISLKNVCFLLAQCIQSYWKIKRRTLWHTHTITQSVCVLHTEITQQHQQRFNAVFRKLAPFNEREPRIGVGGYKCFSITGGNTHITVVETMFSSSCFGCLIPLSPKLKCVCESLSLAPFSTNFTSFFISFAL